MTGMHREEAAALRGRLPDGFRVGVATASYQIEGSVAVDGRKPSIWDTFSHAGGARGDTGDDACDHYRRWREDIDLMSWLGVDAYRFSIAWPRVQPDGRGPFNQAGVDFYDRLVDGLLAAGIEPWATIYHWDLPQALEDAGGWPSRDTAERFAEYAVGVYTAIGDRVAGWSTVNEPWCIAWLGHASGEHAPGRHDDAAAVRVAHHALLGHGLAAAALRAAGCRSLGLGLNLYAVEPASAAPADLDASRRIDGLQNRWFLDAVLRGEYPADVLADLAAVSPLDHIRDGDLDLIGAPIDFLGINYYSSYVVAAEGGAPQDPHSPWVGSRDVRFLPTDHPKTGMQWDVDADGLRRILVRVARDYAPPPIYVMENGAAYDDVIGPDGEIDDPERTAYIAAHLGAVADAADEGADVRGYFLWTLMDNFEWGWGYSQRFGLVHVDHATQVRTPKSSARWFRDLASARVET